MQVQGDGLTDIPTTKRLPNSLLYSIIAYPDGHCSLYRRKALNNTDTVSHNVEHNSDNASSTLKKRTCLSEMRREDGPSSGNRVGHE